MRRVPTVMVHHRADFTRHPSPGKACDGLSAAVSCLRSTATGRRRSQLTGSHWSGSAGEGERVECPWCGLESIRTAVTAGLMTGGLKTPLRFVGGRA